MHTIFPQKRTHHSLHRVTLDKVSWGVQESQAFDESGNTLKARVHLAHTDHTKRLCFYVDASHVFGLALLRKYQSPMFISCILKIDMAHLLSYLATLTKLNYVGGSRKGKLPAQWKRSSACTGWPPVQRGSIFSLTTGALFSCPILSVLL